MGLSVVSATLVIFLAVALAGSGAVREMLASSAALDRAARDSSDRLGARERARVEVSSVLWQPTGTLVVTAVNEGAVVLDAPRSNLLVEGRLRDADVIARTIGGQPAGAWLPGDSLVVLVGNVPTPPARVSVVASNAARAYWGAA